MSVLTSVKTFAFKHKWKLIIAAAVLLPLIALIAFILKPAQIEYVTALSERGNIEQTVEAVGSVISDRDLQLQFPSSGIIAQVYVKEGDTVKAGQRLASLKAGNLAADIASAAARVQQAEADYALKLEGSRPEDIMISEAEVASKRASLESARTTLKNAEAQLETSEKKLTALKQEAIVSLTGYVSNVGSSLTKEITTAQNALSTVRDVFNNNDVVDAVVKYDSYEYKDLQTNIQSAETTLSSAYKNATPADYIDALLGLSQTRSAVNQAMTSINRAFDLMSKLPETESFSESARQTYKADLITQRNSLQTSLNTLDTETKSLQDASANFTTRISAEESAVVSAKGTMEGAKSDISTFEASLAIAEAQLQLKRAPTRKSDLDSALANVRQARASLARAQADFGNTIITSPIAGTITKINIKPGEFTPAGAAITLLGQSPFRVEMYVSEIDVPKVHLTQSGSIELDAFRGTNFALRVTEIDTASTDRDGVPKYRVRLDFVYPHDELKIGMTGDARIVTGTVNDVITIPVRAVLQRDDGTSYVRIQKEDGAIEERSVTTGLEGEGSMIEVTGVQEGETVIVLEKK